jgi:hypothetical protein
MIGRIIGFRLGGPERGEETERALAGPRGELLRALAAELEPGWAFAAVVVEHSWAQVLSDAVARIGGTRLADARLAPDAVADVWGELPAALAAARSAQS